MLTLFMLLAAAGGILRLALAWLLKQRWGVSIGVPQALAGALVVLAGLPEFIKPIPFPVPLGLTIGLLLRARPSTPNRRSCHPKAEAA